MSGHEIPLRGFVDGAALMEHEPEIVQCLSFTVWGGAPQPSLSFGWRAIRQERRQIAHTGRIPTLC